MPSPRLSPETFDYVDWSLVEQHITSLPPARRRWCTKHGSEQCGVGSTLKHWNYQQDDFCPRCGQPEDCTHVLTCTAKGADAVWDDNILPLLDTMEALHLPSSLVDAIAHRLCTWRASLPFRIDPSWNEALTSLIVSQDAIGWKNFLEGLPSTQWIHYISSHYHSIGIDRSPSHAVKKILKEAHSLAWSLWEHRNDILHHLDKPRIHSASAALDTAIIQEHSSGPQNLPPTDHHYFTSALADLLPRSLRYRKAWYLRVTSARLRHFRRLMTDGTIPHPPPPLVNTRVLDWIKNGRWN
jgi:hypothetical protein